MDGSQVVNPYLAGNFAPMRSEDDFQLEVVGEIPAGLAGTFYRNGPNPQFEPRDAYHWFSGDGMIHGFFVEDGKVRYRNRYVRTPKWELEHTAGKALFGTFGNPMTTDPAALGKDSGVANTNVLWHGGRLLALEEGHRPFELDPVTLESRGYRDEYRGKVTAHPKLDSETGEMVWFAYSAGEAPLNGQMSYGVTNAAGEVVRRSEFEGPFASMVHDFHVTRGHVLFPILPLTLSLERAMSGQPPIAWEPARGSHVGVMRRDADVASIRWFTTDACYVFHPMNAWDDGDLIHADVMEYPVAPLFPTLDGSRPQNAFARLVRWTFDLAGNSDSIKRTPLDDLAGEFPRFDERRACLSYRHGWFAGIARETATNVRFDTIAHIDLATGKRTDHVYDSGDSPGEPVFVPRSANAAEGDGWLVAVVYRGAEDRSDFVVYDAQNVAAGPVGVAKVPRRVPFGFHGNWRSA